MKAKLPRVQIETTGLFEGAQTKSPVRKRLDFFSSTNHFAESF